MSNVLLLSQISLPAPLASPALVTNADWRFSVQFVETASPSTPVDLTGISFEGQVRSSVSSVQKLLDISTAAGTLVNGGTNGMLTFAVPKSLFCNLPPGSYVFDLVATASDGVVNLYGGSPATLIVSEGVTR